MGEPVGLHFEIPHRGLTADEQSPRRRSAFNTVARTAALAAAGLARWPHRPMHGPSRIAEAWVIVGIPSRSKDSTRWAPTTNAVVDLLTQLLFDRAARVETRRALGERVVIEVRVMTITPVDDPATRAATAARTETSTLRAPLEPGDESPADEYERIGVRIPPPVDSIERTLEDWEAEAQRELSADPNAVTPSTLQREEKLAGGRGSAPKGRRRSANNPPPTAGEIAERFDVRSRELDMMSPLSDMERAKLALDRSTARIEGQPARGRRLKGASPRIRIRQRVPADLMVTCSVLGPDVESILVKTAEAIKDGRIFGTAQTDVA